MINNAGVAPYAPPAQLHAIQSFSTAACLHRHSFHPWAALRGAIPVFDSRLADRVRRSVVGGLISTVEQARRMDRNGAAYDLEFRLRRRALDNQRSRCRRRPCAEIVRAR